MELTLPVTLAVLGAALLHAGWNALLKRSADKQLDTVAITLGAGVVGLVVAAFIPLPDRAAWSWLAASALVHIAYFALLAAAYHHGELSYAYPIMRGGAPVIVALSAAAIFAEALTPGQALGVAFICMGIAAFAYGRHDRRATFLALANAGVIAIYTIIDAKGVRASGNPVAYAMWFFALNALCIYAYAGLRRGREVPLYLATHWRRVVVGSMFTAGSYGVALWAMTRAPVALVAVLRETAVLFGAALGALFLKEKVTRRRLFATGAVLAGLVVLKL